jgi:WD40 repeat protein
VLLSFREDFLPEVEGWKAELPSLMRNRLRLLPMSADRALQVVSGNTPTGRTHELVTDETAREIVRFVAAVQTGDEKTGRGQSFRKAADATWDKMELEPALLSLVCEGLNEKRKSRAQATIDAALLKETGAAIIGDFYQRCVADVPEKTRRFIEDALITEGGFRNSYPLQDALDQGQLTETLLRQLVDRRLLRIDHQLGADRVELIHDRLTGVVREHRDRERERIRARRQRRMWWATGSVAVVLAAVGALFFFLMLSAQRAERSAERAARETRDALIEADRQRNDAEIAKKTAVTERERADGEAEHARADKVRAELATEQAKRSADAAKAALRETIAGNLVLQSRAILDGQKGGTTDIALLLAAAAYRLEPDGDAYGALHYALNATPQLIRVVSLPEPVVAISPDGVTAVTAGVALSTVMLLRGDYKDDQNKTLRLWDAATGQPRGLPLKGHSKIISGVAFSADSKTLASCSADNTLRLWDVASRRPRREPLGGDRGIDFCAVALSPDGKQIIFAGNNGALHLLNIATGEQRELPDKHMRSLAFSGDGKIFASGGIDGKLRLWNASTREARGDPFGDEYTRYPISVALSSDGSMVVAGDAQQPSLRLWDAARGWPRLPVLKGHAAGSLGVLRVVFNHDDSVLASASGDNTIRLWDVATGKERAVLRGHSAWVTSVAFPGDATVISGSDDKTVRLWGVGTGKRRGGPPEVLSLDARTFAFSPTEPNILVVGTSDGTLKIWDLRSGETRVEVPKAHVGVEAVVFSPDGKTFASSSHDNTVRLWNAATGEPRGGVLKGGQGHGEVGMAFSLDNKTLMSRSSKWTVRVWDVATGQARDDLSRKKDDPVLRAASPDGTILLSAGLDRTLRLWDAASGQPRSALPKELTGPVSAVAFSPDGKTLATGSQDKIVRLWDTATGQPRGGVLEGHDDRVASLAFSPDGKTLVSGGDDRTLRLWDVATGQPLGSSLQGHKLHVNTVAFSTDGKTLASVSFDGGLRLWDTPAVWLERVCAKLVRNLSRAEWKQYVGDIPYVEQCPGLPVPVD